MNLIARLIVKFGHIFILINLTLLTILIITKHPGRAETAGNLLLFLSILVAALQIFKSKAQYSVSDKKNPNDRFLFLLWLGIVLAGMLVFRGIFSPGPAVWGDAPYFYPETFKEFFSEPFVWESRGRLGVVNDLYFIYPLMFIYNGLGILANLSNDVVIRLVFYFPAIFSAFISPWFFVRYLGFSPLVRFFSVTIYALSTYFILLIDGGQVGVALAYGLFPLALLYLHKLVENRTSSQFFLSLTVFMLLSISDVRFAAIAVFTFIIWIGLGHLNSSRKIRIQQLRVLFYLLLAAVALSLYWLIPAFVIEPTTGSGVRSELKLISVLNPLFLFSPHWPINEFGKISPPPWYFAGIPFLVFVNIFFFKKNKYISILILNFLLFAFLVKGESGFLGSIYSWVVDNMPLGGAFRDSTKFFAPLLLFAGILIGTSVEYLATLMKRQIFARLFISVVFIYLLFLISPALAGEMHGVLAGRKFPKDIEVITDKFSSENKFFRTVWFPERHPLSFSSERKPALDAKTLINLRPFSSLNVGDSDVFNFLHSKQFLQWLDIFGIKYLIFSGDTRRVLPDLEKEKDWNNLLSLVENVSGLKKVSWNTNFPVYQTENVKPRFFAVDKVFAVIGGDDIYQKLIDSNEKFSIGNQGFLFFEDGKFNPGSLQQVSPDSLVLIFNQKGKKDLMLSFLSGFFQNPSSATRSEWVLRSPNEYLKWKYELLVNGIKTHEFDYGQGIAFSSQPDEELIFKLKAPSEGEYILAVRHMSASESGVLRMSIAGYEEEIPLNASDRFNWFTKQIQLNKGYYDLTIENTRGFHVVNTAALIPKVDWENASKISNELLAKFPEVRNISEISSLSNWHEVNYKMTSPVEYDVDTLNNSWLIFTDSYHKDWSFKQGDFKSTAYPIYSSINGFYMNKNGDKVGKTFFREQVKLRISLILTLTSATVLAAVCLWIYYGRWRKK